VISSVAASEYFGVLATTQPFGISATPGRGMALMGWTTYVASPCADAQMVDVIGYFRFSAWTSCGLFTVMYGTSDFVATPATGLPYGAQVTALLRGLVGTSNAGVYGFDDAGVLSPSSDGLPTNAPVRSLGFAAGQTYVSLSGGSLYEKSTAPSSWRDASSGLPPQSSVIAIGGSATAFAMVDGHGLWRRAAAGTWRRDSNGADWATVSGFAGSFAAAGPAGVLRHVDGAWMPESSGLPPGAKARAIASAMSGKFFAKSEIVYVGTAGQGLFSAVATPQVRMLPALVDTIGATGRQFRTELTIGSPGSYGSVWVVVSPTLAPTTLNVPAHGELRAPDAVAWLRSNGLEIPAGAAVTSLTIRLFDGFFVIPAQSYYMLARVYTTDPSGGTYGVMLEAPTDIDAAEEEASVYGLRSLAGVDRSNLAVSHAGTTFVDAPPITLSVQVFSADGTPAPNALTRTLAPGEFFQWNDVLLLAGLPQDSSGYARISRTAGVGAWTGYGVVNDAATSDGALLPLYRPGGLAATRRLLVPVVLDAYGAAGSHYTTELTLVNDGVRPSTASLLYHAAPGHGAPLAARAVAVPVAAGAQVTLPDAVAFLRAHGVGIPDPLTSGSQAGTLEVVFQGLDGDDLSRTVALARTTTPNPNRDTGGRFGVSYSAVAWGGGATQSALVPALAQDAASRSNLAVINAGGGSEGAITLSVQLHDADSGSDVGVPLLVTLNPGEWYQWDRVIERAGAATSKAIATVTLVSGDDTFYAYGVVNDEKTSDGSFIRMIRSD
jgi:hypothetical protein